MTSRLDRLFVLLETGSSPATRRAAAKQLGEVQRMYPYELHELLSRISTYLRSVSWETRIAGGQAVEAVLRNLPPWDPNGIQDEELSKKNYEAYKKEFFRFHNFNIERIMAQSACLMASVGSDFDLEHDPENKDQKEYVAHQRKQLNSRLGLDDATASAMGFQLSDLVCDEDFASHSVQHDLNNHSNYIKKSVTEVLSEPSSNINISDKFGATLSSREANRARRKARQLAGIKSQKSRDKEDSGTCSDEIIERKKIKLENETIDQSNEIVIPQNIENLSCVPDATGTWNETSTEWPLHRFCLRLYCDLFSAQWETRHGAATALREVVRAHGSSAGKPADVSKSAIDDLHELWLEDLSLRLLCVLALDRFGDFVSDQVVAPVRETCAQALGSIIHLMKNESVLKVLEILLSLLSQTAWEARHGGLLGLKYMLAIKQEMASLLLSRAFEPILKALSDEVDDVGAVAAAALTPVAPRLPYLLPIELMINTVDTLWDLLLEQQRDDLAAAACNGFMGLLAALIALPEASPCIKPKLMTELIPRLYPFIWHANSSVRKATLETLSTLAASSGAFWPAMPLLQDALRHLFQRALVESSQDIQQLVEKVWCILIKSTDLEALLVASCPMFSSWLCLAVQPARTPFDPSILVQLPIVPASSIQEKNSSLKKQRITPNSIEQTNPLTIANKLFVGGSESIPQNQREANVLPARCMAARMLGLLSSYIVRRVPGTDYTSCEEPIEAYVRVVLVFINSKSAVQRCVAGLVLAAWAQSEENGVPANTPPSTLVTRLHQCLSEIVYWDEIAVNFTKLLQEARDFVATLKHYKLEIDDKFSKLLTLEQMEQLTGPVWEGLNVTQKLKPKVLTTLEERRRNIQSSVTTTSQEHLLLTLQAQSSIAGAVTRLNILPQKLNPVIKPLMESIKKEENELLQELSAKHLAHLMELCLSRDPCPNNKILQNLCAFLRADSEFSPKILKSDEILATPSTSNSVQLPPLIGAPNNTNFSGILALAQRQRSAERAALRRSNSTGGPTNSSRGPGRPPLTAAADLCLEEMLLAEDLANKQNRIQRRGAVHALTAITSHFGSNIPEKIPKLWELIIGKIRNDIDPETFDPSSMIGNDNAAEELVTTLHILEVTASFLDKDLLPQIIDSLPSRLSSLLRHPYRAVRHMASRGLASLAKLGPIGSVPVMTECLRTVVPLLDDASNDLHRQGAVEALSCISETLHVDIVPYVVLLVVPLLGRMSDQNEPVRLVASQCFATLVRLVPLDGAIQEPPGLPKEIIERRDRERGFLHRLLHPAAIEDYRIPITIQANLRSYQQAGVNWLAFLNKYKLHGILCDDMGLGKTLQSICILAGDHFYRETNYKITKSPDCVPLPSLVICPPTITGHWVDEVNKFVSSDNLRAIQYVGSPQERIKLRNKLRKYHLIVASYDVVRKDIEFFSGIKWNYCILDEGHVIKNGKTKSCIAIKMLTANHRLILSGTPIQNNVLELWSLFDFLMPGFLGTEKQFTARYSKPILASRDPKCSPKELEAGALAMESLHRQVLPFLLRRMKEDVLKDLPPKITQDYYCDLSRLQEDLYEDFSRSQAHQSLQEQISVSSTSTMQSNTHIFQALRYLQNVCNHPKLVLQSNHPQFEHIMKKLRENDSSLNDMSHAAKLPALKQLLLDCGIGVPIVSTADPSVVSQHRALIFCQLKAMLDILENDLFKSHMPTVSYLRLDGSVPASSRHNVVTRFNNDPSIDVLLLTTQVGGLGLNLTGADTVIFVEHDWNPMKDLQAMDRAHRIGQRKVVNVYRLITRGTLEEKIMGLQKFKLLTANTVITKENGSLDTMGTDQLLELFSLKDQQQQQQRVTTGSGITMRTVLNSLPELWEDKQYEEEYDLSNFIRGLQHQN